MDKLITAFGAVALFFGGLLFLIPLGTLCGGVAGWVVGLFFSNTLLPIFDQLGIHNVTMFQVGTFLGFVGSFLKTKVTTN